MEKDSININTKKINIATIGCLHGKLEVVYEEISKYEIKNKISIDLVIICGDFQTVRDYADLEYVKMPDKYKHLGDFHLYYKGKKEIPYLTLFIGGNHEASNVLDTFFNGGFLCKNLFYMGKTGIVNFKGIKIAGLSGIFNEKSYYKGFYENRDLLKNDLSQKISIYHVREYDVAKLNMYNKQIDIFISHDWPQGVIDEKDKEKIVKIKKAWMNEVYDETLGSGPSRYLMNKLKPKYWLAGHMHYYYRNKISHNKFESTEFIALDKIIDKNRQFLDIITLEVNEKNSNEDDRKLDGITFDNYWLSLSNAFYDYFPTSNKLYDYSYFITDKKEYEKSLKKVMTFFPKNSTVIKSNSSFNEKIKSLEKGIEEFFKTNSKIIKDSFDIIDIKENNDNNETNNNLSNDILQKDFLLEKQCEYMNFYYYNKNNDQKSDLIKQIEYNEEKSDLNKNKNNDNNYSIYKQMEQITNQENEEEIDIDFS